MTDIFFWVSMHMKQWEPIDYKELEAVWLERRKQRPMQQKRVMEEACTVERDVVNNISWWGYYYNTVLSYGHIIWFNGIIHHLTQHGFTGQDVESQGGETKEGDVTVILYTLDHDWWLWWGEVNGCRGSEEVKEDGVYSKWHTASWCRCVRPIECNSHAHHQYSDVEPNGTMVKELFKHPWVMRVGHA